MDVGALFDRIDVTTGLFLNLVMAASFLVGLIAAFTGMKMVASSGGASMGDANARQRSIGFVLIIGSALMLALPTVMDVTTETLFGAGEGYQNPGEIFSYAPEMTTLFSDPISRKILTSVIFIIQFIGVVAIFRSFNLFMKAPYHPGSGLYGRAATHLFGGALAWNIILFMQPLEELFLG